MKKIFLIISIIFGCCFNIYCQSENYYEDYLVPRIKKHTDIIDSLIFNHKKDPKVENYYTNIYKAQNFIIDGDFKNAAETYNYAFSFLEHPFEKDLNIALKCELKSDKNEKNIKEYIKLLMLKNEDKEKFLSDSLYHSLSNWKDIVNVIENTKPLFEKVLVDELEIIYNDDQGVREDIREYREKNGYHQDSVNDLIAIVDSINYYKILQILDKYSVISEELIGNKWGNLSIVLWHCPYRLDAYIKLFNSVISGKLDARKFSDLLSGSDYRINHLYELGEWTCSGEVVNMDDFDLSYFIIKKRNNLETINEYRKKIYLEDYYTFHNKIFWSDKNRKLKINFYNGVNFLVDNDEFFRALKEKDFDIYYFSKESEEQIKKMMKE
jgi:hypothetical protein